MLREMQTGREFLMATPFGVSTGNAQHFGSGVQVHRLVLRPTVNAQKVLNSIKKILHVGFIYGRMPYMKPRRYFYASRRNHSTS
jgi:hypothetical protein